MENNDLILAQQFGDSRIELSGYENFFEGLLSIASHKSIQNGVGEEIERYVMNYIGSNSITTRNYETETYVRNYLGRDPKTGWEAILMSWQQGNRTAIHSHPQFASYTIMDGEFLVEIFEPLSGNRAKLVQSLTVNTPKCFYAVAEEEGFRNHLHRLTCLSEKGHSLHIYSDDALKGYVYTEV